MEVSSGQRNNMAIFLQVEEDVRVKMALQLCSPRLVDTMVLWIMNYRSAPKFEAIYFCSPVIAQLNLILYWNVHSRQPRVKAEQRVSLLPK
jgi:hypothetical protein